MRVQSKFSPYTETFLRKFFKISDSEKIVSAVYLKGRRGFVFTDKRFYWNLETYLQRPDGNQEIKIPSSILQKNSKSLHVELAFRQRRINRTAADLGDSPENDRAEFLDLKSSIGVIRIKVYPLALDEARFLRRIFVEYIARGFYSEEFLKENPSDIFSFFFEYIGDYFSCAKESVGSFVKSQLEKVREAKFRKEEEMLMERNRQIAEEDIPAEEDSSLPEEDTASEHSEGSGRETVSDENSGEEVQGERITSARERQFSAEENIQDDPGDGVSDEEPVGDDERENDVIDSVENHVEFPSLRTRSVFEFINIFFADVIADFFLIAAAFTGAKPVLHYKYCSFNHSKFSDFFAKLGSLFFINDIRIRQALYDKDFNDFLINLIFYRRNYVFALLLGIFFVAKFFAGTFGAGGTRKLAAFGLLILSVANLFTLSISFWLYLFLQVLIYIAGQFAYNLKWNEQRYKVLFLMLYMFMLYYFLHLFLYPGFIEVMGKVIEMLKIR